MVTFDARGQIGSAAHIATFPRYGTVRQMSPSFSSASPMDNPRHGFYLHISFSTIQYSKAVSDVNNVSLRELARSRYDLAH